MASSNTDEEKILFRLQHLIPGGLPKSLTTVTSTGPQQDTAPRNDDIEEQSFAFEWGSIAAKIWGPRDGKPVLAIHGWLDNCGTFDTLFPLLPKHLRMVAIDIPGHGLSSAYPLGMSYFFAECLPRIRQFTQQLKWDKFSIIGHSLGGAMAGLYAGVFPESVDKIVLLDIVRAQVTFPETMHLRLRKATEVIVKSEAEMQHPEKIISYEKAVELCIKGSAGSLDKQAAEVMLKRGLKPSGNGYVFTRDRRLRAAPLTFTPAQDMREIGKNTTCDVLIIKAKQGPWFESEEALQLQLEAYRTKSKRVEYHVVEGKHHVHLTHPERVAPIINNFFLS